MTAPAAVTKSAAGGGRWPAAARYAGRLLVLMVLVCAVGYALGETVDRLTGSGSLRSADNAIGTWLHDRTCDRPGWPVALAVSELGRPIVLYVLVAAGMVHAWRRGTKANIAYYAITGLTGGIVDTIIKVAVARRRPGLGGCNVGLEGKSFPSGHTMSSTIAYGMLLVVLLPLIRETWKRRTAVGTAVAVLLAIGIARESVGAHYTSDVVLGYVFGLTWLVAGTWSFRRWCDESARATSPM